MSQQKLTKLAVEQIPAQGAEVVVWDTALPGFGVRVKRTGVRSYIIQYRDRTTGTSKRMTIGQHGALLTFDQAKKQARGILADALRGQDPVGERRAVRRAPNMADLASDYLERHAVPKKRPKTVSIWPSSGVGGETTPPRGSSGIGRKSVTDGSRTKSFRA